MTTVGTIHRWARRLWVDQRGQDMIEYALVSALVVGPALSQIFSRVGSVLSKTP